ncbi:uncharacterized protein LOC142140697 [Mixophyes fleayi]|uniref:uncharacterized protein LOC142140697 n=1 Tax=Mixophyes fleayi TaxID=3061075 RepID=UPI003F4DD89D
MDSLHQAGVGISSNRAPGLLGPAPVGFPLGMGGSAHQQSPSVCSAPNRSLASDTAVMWPLQQHVGQQHRVEGPAPSWSLPYPPRGYGSVVEAGNLWSAPYPALAGQYVHSYPQPSLFNSSGVSGTDTFSLVRQQGSRDQGVPPQAGFLGHLMVPPPVPTPDGVPTQQLHNLSSPRANMPSYPASQMQPSSVAGQTGVDGAGSQLQQEEAAGTSTGQQGSHQVVSEGEGGARLDLQEAQAAVGFSVKKTRIWVVGHSFIFWAAKHRIAESLSGFTHPVDIRWLGKRGMVWAALIPTLREEIEVHGTPDIVVIHLGGNDVGKGKSLDLIINIREDLAQIHARWPSMKVCWSNIIPRLSWRSSIPPATLIKVVKKINGYARQNIRGTQGVVISHPGLTVDKRHLFRADGVHLSPVGTVLFIERIFSELKGLVFSLGGGPRGP